MRRSTQRVAGLALATLAACHAPTPAATPAPNPTPGDAQATHEPRSAPGEGQQFLARMAGEWDVQKTFHRRGGGEPTVARGTCHQEMIHDGRFLQSQFVFAADNGTTTGTGIIGFDAATGTFTSFWIDSRSTRVSVRKSDGAFDGKSVELVGRSIGDETSTRRSRTATVIEDGDQSILHRQWSQAEDGTERVVMELKMTRKPAK